MRTGTETYARRSEAERALTLTEAAIVAGEWTDPERGKVSLGDYAATWIARRPGLRVRTVDLYSWFLAKHIAPYLGGVPIGKVSTPMIRKWRADLLGNGVSVSMAAKAYRLLRAGLTTAVEEDKTFRTPLPGPGRRGGTHSRAAGAHRRSGLRPRRANRAAAGRRCPRAARRRAARTRSSPTAPTPTSKPSSGGATMTTARPPRSDPRANGPLMARTLKNAPDVAALEYSKTSPEPAQTRWERATGIEPA